MLTSFETKIHECFSAKQFSKITFFNEYREFYSVDALIKSIGQSETGETIILSTGDEIPLDKVISINGCYAENYKHIEDFTCDC
ncbi:hypothetical protein EV198_0730 [Roseivirga ehrenbergii]|uniref:Uncharacterized protein n=1 Tax=Roseivirga ehrenbergii (strain DSM 102268 / JCM 13514 / KCTC 12282 / NCIMB 14502 / KMM 6017) TaxID=279360 RepID=A0A150X7S3_ROSEK|nr:hypothetical protein [Roseivirga ehrenbergii]KYG74771.1 hypothetical protein MB14_06085 [Roseivirga ehrenbergii]TCL13898.1 hypothetical protein EV198_0730 [Roseivirga ehrenbergii]